MGIRLETSKRTGIKNYQEREISCFELNWSKDLSNQYPKAKMRTNPSSSYNCHGLTFASRRTNIDGRYNINLILKDDNYEEKPLNLVLPGDVVIYFSEEGDPNHSGFIVEHGFPLLVPIVCSKWGNAGEFVHALADCPSLYGPHHKFYRCKL